MTSPRPPTNSNPLSSSTAAMARVDTQTTVLDTAHGRILCIADIRGRLSALNDLARENQAIAIIHTGDFGFFEATSLDRINDRTLRHLTTYSPLIPAPQRSHLTNNNNPSSLLRSTVTVSLLSEFPLLLAGQIQLSVPVYTTWGACEDVLVLEKIRLGTYSVPNLHVLDEATTRCIDVGGVKLRLLALGGALVPHKMFDNGEGNATIAGGQGTMWTTALQIGQLVDTAQRVFDPTETRLLVSHASPGREGILAQLALVLRADLTISAGLHFRYATSYNEFSIQPDFEAFRSKLTSGKEQFDKVWENVKTQVDAVIDVNQRVLLDKALSVAEKIPLPLQATEEAAWKNCWNWNLCDAAYGALILDIKDGRVSAELKSQGFNYAYRRVAPTPTSAVSSLPHPNPVSSQPPTKAATPVPPANKSTPPPPQPQSQAKSEVELATATAASPVADSKPDKKKKEKRERKDKEKERDKSSAASPVPASPAPPPPKMASPAPPKPSTPAPNDDIIKSPATESSGARTPQRNKPQRNPWTIFMRLTIPATDAEVRDFFGDAKDGITRITFPVGKFNNRMQKIAYIEFGDEDAMKAGLEKHAEKLKDTVPEVKQATDKETRQSESASHRGRGSGGRGRGGGFAARGFAAAGLTRRDSEKKPEDKAE
ncbi:uncharacterized protein EV420DRAFT_1625906 [Desarmillaria tabescens]|uniref:RRM domain-containing protein n=1 Tax=Armillaria tabescens TaxID=1929756 RepID=A0AA39NLF2_ARMTA|nr:uncharacterized protein EV420DRAFT_1625906 [Desarmillaria tabescens]KAK0467792.1 hypothetical protein EV420DRAFT_1625906 [Desarmillaria tabescens]